MKAVFGIDARSSKQHDVDMRNYVTLVLELDTYYLPCRITCNEHSSRAYVVCIIPERGTEVNGKGVKIGFILRKSFKFVKISENHRISTKNRWEGVLAEHLRGRVTPLAPPVLTHRVYSIRKCLRPNVDTVRTFTDFWYTWILLGYETKARMLFEITFIKYWWWWCVVAVLVCFHFFCTWLVRLFFFVDL